MDPKLVALGKRTAQRLGIDAPEMASGAGHDCAVFANEGVPCAMIFIRNDHSSHNPKEAMDIDDFAEACRLLHGMTTRGGARSVRPRWSPKTARVATIRQDRNSII